MDVTSYDSLEAMFADMAEREAAANAAVCPEQAAVRDATDTVFWMRPYESIVIFGRTPSVAAYAEIEYAHLDRELAGADPAERAMLVSERAAVLPTFTDRRARGYLTGDCFSVWEAEGEWGDTHCSQVWPISSAQFEAARAAGWDFADPALRAALADVSAQIRAAVAAGVLR